MDEPPKAAEIDVLAACNRLVGVEVVPLRLVCWQAMSVEPVPAVGLGFTSCYIEGGVALPGLEPFSSRVTGEGR